MNALHPATAGAATRRRSDRRRAGLACRLFAAALAVAALPALASRAAAQTFDAAADIGIAASAAPWEADVLLALDPYVPDPVFNGGRLQHDHFALINDRNPIGGVTAPLSNGDMLVAGLVPSSNIACSDGTHTCSIGLVRYDAAGNRQTWSNPGSYGHYFDQYIRYPGNAGLHEFVYLRDVKVRPGFIDVLVDDFDDNHPEPTLGRQNVRIYTFREDGSFFSQAPVFGTSGGTDAENFYGGQIVYINDGRLMVVGTGYDNIGPYVAVARMVILANGAPSYDGDWGSPYGTLTRIRRYFGPGGYCGASEPRCAVTAYKAAAPTGVSTVTDFYVGASIRIGGDNWDAIVLKISSQTGALKTEFNGTGWSRAVFDDPGSSLRDITAGIYAYRDDVYVAAQVARRCYGGIGLALLDGGTGDYVGDFGGGGGMIVFGGSAGSGSFCPGLTGAHVPTAISATAGRIGVVGYNEYYPSSGVTRRDPMLAVVNTAGSVLGFDRYPILESNGERAGDGQFAGEVYLPSLAQVEAALDARAAK